MNIEQSIMNQIVNQALSAMNDWNASRNMQKMFVIEYVKENFSNATEAAKRAGYAESNARQQGAKLLQTRHVKNVLTDVQELFEDKSMELSIMSSIEIKQYLTRVVRGEETEQILIGLGHGKQGITKIQVSASDRIRAAELLGKSMKMWTDKVEHEYTLPVFVNDLLDDDELED